MLGNCMPDLACEAWRIILCGFSCIEFKEITYFKFNNAAFQEKCRIFLYWLYDSYCVSKSFKYSLTERLISREKSELYFRSQKACIHSS